MKINGFACINIFNLRYFIDVFKQFITFFSCTCFRAHISTLIMRNGAKKRKRVLHLNIGIWKIET